MKNSMLSNWICRHQRLVCLVIWPHFSWCRTHIFRLLGNAGMEKTQGCAFHILLCHICPHTFRSFSTPPLLGSAIYLPDFLLSCSQKSLMYIQPFFLTASGLRVSLNPDAANIPSLDHTLEKHMQKFNKKS